MGVEVVKYEKEAKVSFTTLNCIDKMKALNAEAVKKLRGFISLLWMLLYAHAERFSLEVSL